MTDKANLSLVILYEEEILAAAKLLHELFSMPEDTPPAEINKLISPALHACRVALYHPALVEDSRPIMMITSQAAFKRHHD